MLALMRLRELSTLEELFERVRLEVWLAVMLAFKLLSTTSTLELELERVKLDV